MNSYLSDICTLCLIHNRNLKSILSQDTDGTVVEEKLKVFLLELIHFKPDIPKYICNNCLLYLNNIHKFRKKCLENITTLSKYVQKLEANEPYINLSITLIDTECEKEHSNELENQCNGENHVRKYDLQKNPNQTNSTNVINIIKTEDESLEDNVVVKQEYDNIFSNFQSSFEIFEECNEVKHIIDDNINITNKNNIPEPSVSAKINREGGDSEPESFQDNASDDDDYLPSNASSSVASEASKSDTHVTDIQIPVSSKVTESNGANKNGTKSASVTSATNKNNKKARSGNKRSKTTQLHSGSRRYKCTTCPKSYKQMKTLTIHLRSHTGEKPFECDLCAKKFTSRGYLMSHKLIHTDHRPYECSVCGKTFKRSTDRAIHMRTHNSGDKSHACATCDEPFPTKYYLDKHVRSVHSHDNQGGHDSNKARARPCKCPDCPKAFRFPSQLAAHRRVHTGARPYQCPSCPRAFQQVSGLNLHVRAHNDDKRFACGACGKRFVQKTTMLEHQRVHNNEWPFKCARCSAAFRTSSARARHMRVHTGEKPHQCGRCGYRCADASALTMHMRKHTGERPYTCKHCQMRFVGSNTMMRHIRTKHS